MTVDLRSKSPLADFFIIASGTSSRHVIALSEAIVEAVHQKKIIPLSVEGKEEGEWVLVDLNDVILHLFKPETRAHYNLEKIWSLDTRPEVTRVEMSELYVPS